MKRATFIERKIKDCIGKDRFEDWGDWFDRTRRAATCRVFGHAKPHQKMKCTVCSRCYRVLASNDTQLRVSATRDADGKFRAVDPRR